MILPLNVCSVHWRTKTMSVLAGATTLWLLLTVRYWPYFAFTLPSRIAYPTLNWEPPSIFVEYERVETWSFSFALPQLLILIVSLKVTVSLLFSITRTSWLGWVGVGFLPQLVSKPNMIRRAIDRARQKLFMLHLHFLTERD